MDFKDTVKEKTAEYREEYIEAIGSLPDDIDDAMKDRIDAVNAVIDRSAFGCSKAEVRTLAYAILGYEPSERLCDDKPLPEPGVMIVILEEYGDHDYVVGEPVLITRTEEDRNYVQGLRQDYGVGNRISRECPFRPALNTEIDEFFSEVDINDILNALVDI
jgi:hypothetical protein